MAHEESLYKKLIKIEFFQHFTKIKYIGKWKDGSKMARFLENRKNVYKLLDLSDQKLLASKIELFNDF